MKRHSLLLLCALLAVSCGKVRTYRCDDGTSVRLSAAGADMIHVEAIPEGASFDTGRHSLAVLPQRLTRMKEKRDGGTVTLSTDSLTLTLSLADGRIEFRRRDGTLLTAENRREFSPIEVEGDRGWSARQVFDSPDDEGFYGLGQHQADEWDYKGRNEELYQYNTKISVPFIVSSRSYGILWDSYSLVRWGDPRPYAQLSEVFRLYDADGAEGALTGTYTAADGSVLVRREQGISQEFLRTPECDRVTGAPEGFRFNHSHVVFEGQIEPLQSGLHHFYLYYAGYTKVFLDGVQVMPEIWRTAWNPNGRKFEADLEQGRKVSLRIEWEPDGGTSYCALKALSPVSQEEQSRMSWWSEMADGVDYWMIAGENPDAVIKGYRTLTGKAQVMPKWALGYWQSRERYRTQKELLETLREFRRRGIPVDNMVQDWQYWLPDQWGSHEFDPERYPDPKGMVDTVHALGARYMISVWPKFYTNTEHFKEFDSKGWMYPTPVRDSVEDWLGYQQSFYDAYSEGARKLFWKQMEDHLYGLGVDAWWMDASEPNIHDCTDMDYRKAMAGPTALGPSTRYFNAYALMNAQAIYEGQRAAGDKRVFLLTRNGFAGLQRYSTASWSGDIGTRWEDMKAQVSAGLNYSISGIPFWGQDVGGFSVENRYSAAQKLFDRTGDENADLKEWRELQARWHEWGVFNPIYRSHGQWPAREPWNIAPEGTPAYEAICSAIRLRYSLMPYIYSMAARVHFEDYTVMRPLMMDFTADRKARGTGDEYMFGDAILVCPVTEYGARSRSVYLPEGSGWYDTSDLKYFEGGQTVEAEAPLERIPTFIRSGQILPTADPVSSTAQRQDDIYLDIYAGADAALQLYDDNGLDYSYEKGQYSRIPVSWNDSLRMLEIGSRQGSWEGMPDRMTFTVRVITPEGASQQLSLEYSGARISILL